MSETALPYVVHPANKGLSLLPKGRLATAGVEAWLTLDDGSIKCEKVGLERLGICWSEAAIQDYVVIDPKTRFQQMLGIGGTITDSDTYNLQRLTKGERAEAIAALVSPEKGLGFNLMRIPFGTTDWNRNRDYYTYSDEKDMTLANFSLAKDIERGQIAIIKEFLAANPAIKLLASVWGLPAWMKSNNHLVHGVFLSEYTDVYADYLVKSLQAYEAEGIHIDYITSQNEPGTADDRNTPATMWSWEQQRDITIALKQRIDKAGLKTKIWAFDHNFDMTQIYVKPMLDDVRFRKSVEAVAFHDYRGKAEEMTLLHYQFPDLPVVLTERARGSLGAQLQMMTCFRHWATGHISWTTVSDDHGGPHQFAAGTEKNQRGWNPFRCGSILTVPRAEPARLVRPIAYYYYGHFTNFIARGATRLLTNLLPHDQMNNVAYENPDGTIAVVLGNNSDHGTDLAVVLNMKALLLHLPGKSMVTLKLPAGAGK